MLMLMTTIRRYRISSKPSALPFDDNAMQCNGDDDEKDDDEKDDDEEDDDDEEEDDDDEIDDEEDEEDGDDEEIPGVRVWGTSSAVELRGSEGKVCTRDNNTCSISIIININNNFIIINNKINNSIIININSNNIIIVNIIMYRYSVHEATPPAVASLQIMKSHSSGKQKV